MRKPTDHWITGWYGRFFLHRCMNFGRLHSVYTKSFCVKWPRTILQGMKSFLHNICNVGKFWGLLHTESEVTKEMETHDYPSDWWDCSSFTPCGPASSPQPLLPRGDACPDLLFLTPLLFLPPELLSEELKCSLNCRLTLFGKYWTRYSWQRKWHTHKPTFLRSIPCFKSSCTWLRKHEEEC